jgi:ATP-dependent Zn protease
MGILVEHRDKLDALAEALIEFETLGAEEVRAVIRGEKLKRNNK